MDPLVTKFIPTSRLAHPLALPVTQDPADMSLPQRCLTIQSNQHLTCPHELTHGHLAMWSLCLPSSFWRTFLIICVYWLMVLSSH